MELDKLPGILCSFCFIPLLQISPLITEVQNIFGDPRLLSATFLPKYLWLHQSLLYCIVVGIYQEIYITCKTNCTVSWLVGCFGFNGPLRHYFSPYRAVSQREGEREEKR